MTDVEFFHVKTPRMLTAPVFALHDVQDFRTLACRNVEDMHLETVAKEKFEAEWLTSVKHNCKPRRKR